MKTSSEGCNEVGIHVTLLTRPPTGDALLDSSVAVRASLDAHSSMSASPIARSPSAAASNVGQGSDTEAKERRSQKIAADHSDDDDKEDDEDDLFGDDDGVAAEDEDEDDVPKPTKQRRRVQSGSPDAAQSQRQQSLAPSSPSASSTGKRDDYAALEHRETSTEPPMGHRDIDGEDEKYEDVQEAQIALPSLPVRRGAPHFYGRLPNLLQYRAEGFDSDTFDDEQEDEQLQEREGIRIDDKGLRSLLISSNTIRWQHTDKTDADGVKARQSNARIIRWSDGTSSLQLGSEFYDISTASERVQGGAAPPSTSSIIPPQPIQHLTHLFVKHDGQDQVNLFQAEAPILGSMMFRPTSITSESHQRLAKAVRKQKGTLVKETVVKEDPEVEKERFEKEHRKAQQKRMREARKRQKAAQGDDDDDDAFWANARSTRRSMAGRASDMYDDDERGDAVLAGLEQDDDGFVVEDEDESGNGEPRSDANDMDVDEPDEMDRMEARMERQEARRRARENERADEDEDAKPAAGVEEAAGASSTRRRRIVEESDEE